ncbi:hypothetical protein GMMP1_1420006 [Candidatus Magnetomoraceae bacterium gMMP-1]
MQAREKQKSNVGTIYRYHEVRAGETLYRIGLRYGISVKKLRKLNNLSENIPIRPGQRLLVGQTESQ